MSPRQFRRFFGYAAALAIAALASLTIARGIRRHRFDQAVEACGGSAVLMGMSVAGASRRRDQNDGAVDGAFAAVVGGTLDATAPTAPVDSATTAVRFDKIASQVAGMLFQLRRHPDIRWQIMYVSPGIVDLFGITAASALSDVRAMAAALHPEDREKVAEGFANAARTLQPWQSEFRSVPRPNETRWLWAKALPELQPDGSIDWHGFVADITERRRAEQEHEENRAVLQSILSSVDLGVFLVDVLPTGDFRFVEVNPAYEQLTGISSMAIRGKSPQELLTWIAPEMVSRLQANFRRGAAASGPIEFEEPFYVRGRLVWWLTRLTPIRDAKGRVLRLVGRSLDITERKSVELRVQSLTERLQLATEAAGFGIWDYDLLQNRLSCDSRLLALYSLTAAEFKGTLSSWRERVHADDREALDRQYHDAIENGQEYNPSFRIVWPNGDERVMRARAFVQRNPAGRAVRMVAVHWDVTAERLAQAQIEMARDQAEDLNRQLEDALERAHRLAQEAAAATVAKSEFLANMSHEIRTPLNAIIGMSGLLLGTELNKEQREFADTIRCSGDGLLTLVNDILDYSKIESGRLELEVRPFDLRDAVESCIDVLAARAAEKKIDLVYTIDAGVPEAIASDVVRLKQVVINLLSNAVKFTAKGEVHLCVGAVPAQDSGRVRLRLSVRDSGIGIPPDRMDRLFKTFSQVDASTTRQYGGTGLGLAISKRIVELMGGRIWVESAVGKGSTFIFEVEGEPAPAIARKKLGPKTAQLAGRRLLVIDDNATCSRAVCQQAAGWGMIPRAVSTAAEAQALLERGERADVVLMDYAIGETDGLAAIEQLRHAVGDAAPPMALMTVPGFLRTREKPNAVPTIHKPIKMAALSELLCEMLQGRASAGSSAETAQPGLQDAHPVSILVAEDNPVNQRVAVLMLQRLGYKADVVSNGREAIRAALQHPYDLILMDVQMPEVDGLHAAEEICAKLPPERRPRIVAMTANASVGDRDRCLQVGMSDFLTKPVRAEDLRRAIEETPLVLR
jgi:PAS domain S-box-containing protein